MTSDTRQARNESWDRRDSTIVFFDGVPPSYNETRYLHWSKQAKLKKEWQALWELLLMEARVPRGLVYVEAKAMLRFPTSRRRDEDNYKTPIAKSLGDALVNGGWLTDDTPEFFKMGDVGFEPTPGPLRTTLVVEWVQDAKGQTEGEIHQSASSGADGKARESVGRDRRVWQRTRRARLPG